MSTTPKIVIVGGGAAGMQAAISLARAGLQALIVEQSEQMGGHLREWYHLFPSNTPAREVLDGLKGQVDENAIEVRLGARVERIEPKAVVLQNGERIEAAAVVVASGFEVFDARLKEEYGYSIYDNVVTTLDIERMLREGNLALADGTAPRRIAFVHCVGSRDEKVAQRHCSKVCCVTAVKQAMELRARFPEAEIYNFYMDIRMFGPGYEELYQQAQQEAAINFIRGRVSEASPTIDGRIQIKAEDTLVGRPMKMSVDMLVLVVGMKAAGSNASFALTPDITLAPNGFFAPVDLFMASTRSSAEGIFYAGAATAPKTIGESIAEGALAADEVARYLSEHQV